jgi:hypothetical protein
MKDRPSLVKGAETNSTLDARGTRRVTISRHGAPPAKRRTGV